MQILRKFLRETDDKNILNVSGRSKATEMVFTRLKMKIFVFKTSNIRALIWGSNLEPSKSAFLRAFHFYQNGVRWARPVFWYKGFKCILWFFWNNIRNQKKKLNLMSQKSHFFMEWFTSRESRFTKLNFYLKWTCSFQMSMSNFNIVNW